MNRSNCKALLAGVFVLIASVFVALPVSAFTFANNCNGVVTWSGLHNMFRDTCSMPDGSTAGTAYLFDSVQWGLIGNTQTRMNFNNTYNAGCTISHGNGRNETAVVARSSIGGNAGLTVQFVSTCFFSAGTYNEADVMVASDMDFSNEDESFFNHNDHTQGMVVLMHEFGHLFGLGHQAGFDIMKPSTPQPLCGGSFAHAAAFADDAAGVRVMYGNSATLTTNVFASGEKMGSDVVSTDASGTVGICRGQQRAITVTVVNNGQTTVTNAGFRLFLTQTPGSTSGGIDLLNTTFTSTAQTFFTQPITVTIPFSVPNGVWFIQWQLDAGNGVSEYNETDNFVHSAMTFNVSC